MIKKLITRRDFLKKTAVVGTVGVLSSAYTAPKVLAASMEEAAYTEVENKDVLDDQIKPMIVAEIEQEKEILLEMVYRQLEMQNATKMMPLYEEILIPEIEQMVRDRYSQCSEAEIRATTTTLTKGGTVAYTTSAGVKVATTYLLNTQTGSYNTGSIVELVMSFIVGELMGLGANWVPGIGHVLFVYRALMLIPASLTILQWNSALSDANGYVRIMNVEDASGSERSSAVLPWTNYKSAYVPSSSEASNVVVERFVNTVFPA